MYVNALDQDCVLLTVDVAVDSRKFLNEFSSGSLSVHTLKYTYHYHIHYIYILILWILQHKYLW